MGHEVGRVAPPSVEFAPRVDLVVDTVVDLVVDPRRSANSFISLFITSFMSAPPSPHISNTNTQLRKKDRPPALDIPQDNAHASSDGEIRYKLRVDTKVIIS